MKKLILFDLDGVIADPKEGITKSVQYSLSKFNIQIDDLDKLEKYIGPPLKESFIEYQNFDNKTAGLALKYYREYFKKKGMFENAPYGGIENFLQKLLNNNQRLLIATSKPTIFAKKILKHFNLDQYFEKIVGSNLDGRMSNKAEIIKHIINQNKNVSLREIVMVGDRKHDIIGAKKNKIDSIGVLYGYGSKEELKKAGATYAVENIDELNILLSS